MIKNIALYIIVLFFTSLIFLSSCDTFNAEVEVPTYVQVDSVKFVTRLDEGTSNQLITDVWFNLDGTKVGAFEIPTRFPVIAKGRRAVSISGGILKNGIRDFREVYPFFEVIKDTFEFVGAEIIPITPVFEYKTEAEFWIEDFEDPGLKLHTNDSINYLSQITDPENSTNHIGYVFLPDTTEVFQVFTKTRIELSTTPIYMEIEYKCDESFGIGILVEHMGGSYEDIRPFSIIKPRDDWNKLYLNLAEQFNNSPGGVSYDVYFFFASNPGEEAHIYLDNIKIVYF